MTAHKRPARSFLAQMELQENRAAFQNQVIIENYFGRLSVKFQIRVWRWMFTESLCPWVFSICCVLANFDIWKPESSPFREDDMEFSGESLRMLIATGL
jgi:hypothetical protein